MQSINLKDSSCDTRNILVVVSGGSPAIVTETFWALSEQEKVRIGEVGVITTKGRIT